MVTTERSARPMTTSGRSERRKAASSGLTLPEVLVSVAVLAIVMSSFSGAVNSAQRVFWHTRNQSEAIAVVEALTEQLLIMDASDDALSLEVHTQQYNKKGQQAASEDDTFYVARWVVSKHESVAGIRRVDIEVSWLEYGTPRSVGWFTYRN